MLLVYDDTDNLSSIWTRGSILGTKGTCSPSLWTDLRRKLKPQQRFYVIALLLRRLCFKKKFVTELFSLQRLLSHSAIAYSHGHVFPCTLTFSKYLSLEHKLSFLRWGWQHQSLQNWFTCEGRKRKALHAVFTAASQFYPQGLSPPVQCQASISTSYCNGSCTFLPLHLCNFFCPPANLVLPKRGRWAR